MGGEWPPIGHAQVASAGLGVVIAQERAEQGLVLGVALPHPCFEQAVHAVAPAQCVQGQQAFVFEGDFLAALGTAGAVGFLGLVGAGVQAECGLGTGAVLALQLEPGVGVLASELGAAGVALAHLAGVGGGFAVVPGFGGGGLHAPGGVGVAVLADFSEMVRAQLHAGRDGPQGPVVVGLGFAQVIALDVLGVTGLQRQAQPEQARPSGVQSCQAVGGVACTRQEV